MNWWFETREARERFRSGILAQRNKHVEAMLAEDKDLASFRKESARLVRNTNEFISNLDKTLAERGSSYGDWQDQSWLAQKLKNDMRGMKGWEKLDHMLRNSLEMIAEKMSRAVCGDGSKIEDTLLDIEGYSRITRERLTKGKED